MSLDSAMQHLLNANRVSGNKQAYATDNPNEWSLVKTYALGGARPTGIKSEMGLAILEFEDERRVVVPDPPDPGPAAAVYVSPTGSDGNSGTEASPFRTLTKARDHVRTLTAGMTSDITVVLREGAYAPLALTAADSGQNGHTVVWKAYPGEEPCIDGGTVVSSWSLFDAARNIYRASTPVATRQVYVAGRRAQRARGPSFPAGWTKTGTGYTAPNSAMASWGNKDKIEIVGFHSWKLFRMPVASISGTTVTMQTPCWTNAQLTGAYNVQLPAWVENAYELLTDEGEFYLDEAADFLYYKPRAGENMALVEVVAATTQTLMTITGASHVRFEGITFQHAGWLTPSTSEGYVGLQAGVHFDAAQNLVKTPGAITVSGSTFVTFADCTFRHLGGAGVDITGGSQSCEILSSHFSDVSSSAIQIGRVDDPGQTDPARQHSKHLVKNNRVANVGAEYFDAAAVFCGYVRSTKITHNDIQALPYTGVSLGWGWGQASYAQANEVSYNYIHDYLNVLDDGAAIYTLSPQSGTLITRNHCQDAPVVNGALYPDEGSAHMEWSFNVCRQVVKWLHIWQNTINNLNVHDNWSDTPNYTNNGTAITLSNNVVVTGGNWPAGATQVMSEAGVEAGH